MVLQPFHVLSLFSLKFTCLSHVLFIITALGDFLLRMSGYGAVFRRLSHAVTCFSENDVVLPKLLSVVRWSWATVGFYFSNHTSELRAKVYILKFFVLFVFQSAPTLMEYNCHLEVRMALASE